MKYFTFAPFYFIKINYRTAGINFKAVVFLFFLFPATSLWAGSKDIKFASRIVSTSPSITETLFALGLGHRVVGVTDFCEYPPEACQLSSIGGMINPSMETLVSLQPDLDSARTSHGLSVHHPGNRFDGQASLSFSAFI